MQSNSIGRFATKMAPSASGLSVSTVRDYLREIMETIAERGRLRKLRINGSKRTTAKVPAVLAVALLSPPAATRPLLPAQQGRSQPRYYCFHSAQSLSAVTPPVAGGAAMIAWTL